MSRSARMAILGGTFDPIHNGHLAVAEEVRSKLGMDEIVIIPAGRPRLKQDHYVTPASHRLAMVELAVKDHAVFRVSTVEIDSPGPTCTVDTLETIRRQQNSSVDIYFLLGSDALRDLPRWKKPRRLLELCYLVVFSRPGSPLPPLEGLETFVPGISTRAIQIEVPQVDISATDIRLRVARREPITGMVPAAVERYIHEHGLYRDLDSRG